MRNGASDRLWNFGNDEHDHNLSFPAIMELVRQEHREELPPPRDEEAIKMLEDVEAAIDEAIEMYDWAMILIAERMKRSDNPRIVSIGEALESGDWSHLAV